MKTSLSFRLDKAAEAINEADYVLLGGGAGLSAAAGIEYSGDRFTDNFQPFIEKYGLTDMYTSGFYPFPTQEEKWAYWAKHISMNRYAVGATKLYMDLFQLLRDKNHFVITTNVDSQFVKSGFSKEKVFEVQGNYGYLQCAKGCHDRLYNNETLVKEMVEETVDCMIPSELVPSCPVCGGKMEVNVRINQYFVQDDTWHRLNQSLTKFIKKIQDSKVVYLELGVGYNTPGIIRYPFEKWTYNNQNAKLIRFNRDNPDGPKETKNQSISFIENMQDITSTLLNK
ncbi:Sir2 family NAD-dependent protein deacetylase [Terribacillus saccharophilus]|uniref:Sir2 family NAD-dependent protein deacetylase n=1 Tax=Terribacillus saccharophilus TaxID=361277 RepID=UPI003981CBE1